MWDIIELYTALHVAIKYGDACRGYLGQLLPNSTMDAAAGGGSGGLM